MQPHARWRLVVLLRAGESTAACALTLLELVPGLSAPRDRPRGSESVARCPRRGLPRFPAPPRRFQFAQASIGGGVGALYLRKVGKALVESRLNPLHSFKRIPVGGGGAVRSARRFLGTRLDSTVLPRDEVVPLLALRLVPASRTRYPIACDFTERIHPRWVGLLVTNLRRRTRWPCPCRGGGPLVQPWHTPYVAPSEGDFGESKHVMAGVEEIVPVVASQCRLRPRRGKVDRATDHLICTPHSLAAALGNAVLAKKRLSYLSIRTRKAIHLCSTGK